MIHMNVYFSDSVQTRKNKTHQEWVENNETIIKQPSHYLQWGQTQLLHLLLAHSILLFWTIFSCEFWPGGISLYCWWLIRPIQNEAENLKLFETLAHRYSSENTQQELYPMNTNMTSLNGFQKDCVLMAINSLNIRRANWRKSWKICLTSVPLHIVGVKSNTPNVN